MILLAALLAAAPAISDQQFDLDCHGMAKSLSDALGVPETHPFSMRIRVDLEQKVYCVDQCKSVADIQDIRSDALVFEEANPNHNPSAPTTVFMVRRSDGTLISTYIPPRGELHFSSMRGRCEKAPYSGIPQSRKF